MKSIYFFTLDIERAAIWGLVFVENIEALNIRYSFYLFHLDVKLEY